MPALPTKESLTVEFKRDRDLSDGDIVLAAICLANSEGGRLFIGIENNGKVSGATAARQDKDRLGAMIANRTMPPLSVRVSVHMFGADRVTEIEVPRSGQLIGTRDGQFQRRVIKADGTPECVGMQPHDLAGRLSDLGQADFTAQPVTDLTTDAFDPTERERLLRFAKANKGDQSLVSLTPAEFDAALGLTVQDGRKRIPTIAGLLLLGKPDIIASRIPTHEVAFQVLRGSNVLMNEFYRYPLGRVVEQLTDHLKAFAVEQEINIGMLRVSVPSIDRRAFREAVVNALTHRDYARLGQVYVQLSDDLLTVSSPGGFMRGVTLENILRVPPTPRNPRLADAFKRLGLSERTGRGVDIIFEGAVRYGRLAPSYRQSTADSVVLTLDVRPADLSYVEAIVREEQRLGSSLSLNALVVLAKLKAVKRATVAELTDALQLGGDADLARGAVEELVDGGLVQAHGTGKGRSYTMSGQLYRALGQAAAHVRQAGFDAEQQSQMILNYVRKHGQIKRLDVIDLCHISEDQAKRLLKKLVAEGSLEPHGSGRGRYYKSVTSAR